MGLKYERIPIKLISEHCRKSKTETAYKQSVTL